MFYYVFSFRNSQCFKNIFTSAISLEGKCLILLTPYLKHYLSRTAWNTHFGKMNEMLLLL